MPIPTWTPLPSVQYVTFFDPNNPLTTFTPQLNPVQIPRAVGNVRKYTETVNGGVIILGDKEYPPKEIGLVWNQLDDSDFQKLVKFSYLFPCAFVDNNDNGFIGCLVFDQVQQVPKVTKKIWQVKASFLVTSPYNGLVNAIPQLDPPALTLQILDPTNTPGNPGYITASTTQYFWATIVSRTGESTVGQILTATSIHNYTAFVLSFTAPVSYYYLKTRIYWSNQTIAANATFLADIWAGQTATFTAFGPYVNYSNALPPSFSQSFTGYWAGATWIPDATGGSSSVPPYSTLV